MKQLKTIVCALVLLAAVSCAKEQQRESGRVSFQVVNSQDLTQQTRSDASGSASGSKVSDYTTLPSTSDFMLSIVNTSTEEEAWAGKVTEWTEEILLPAGTYSVTASYGNVEEEGFDKPYFTTGSKDDENLPNPVQFAIVGGDEPVKVTVPVVLGNSLVKFECTEEFKNYYKDYTFNLIRNGKDIAVFTKAEHIDVEKPKAAFIDGAVAFEIGGTFTSESGSPVKYSGDAEIKGLDPATIYTIKVDLENVGSVTPAIKIDLVENLTDVDLGDVELNEDEEEDK